MYVFVFCGDMSKNQKVCAKQNPCLPFDLVIPRHGMTQAAGDDGFLQLINLQGVIKWDPFWACQISQMYGNFEGGRS